MSTNTVRDGDGNGSEEWFDDLIDSYSSNFTIHGISKIWHGQWLEKILWGLVTIITFSFIIYFGFMYLTRYLAYEHRTLIDYEEQQSIALPVITLCPSLTFLNTFYCYKNQSFNPFYKCKPNKNDASLWYNVGGDAKWNAISQADDGCFVFNSTTAIAPRKEFVRFIYQDHSMTSLHINYQTSREHKFRKENKHITQYNSFQMSYQY